MFILIAPKILKRVFFNVFPAVQNLAIGDWFTSRTSACALFPVVYDKCVPLVQAKLRHSFAELCRDEMPSVRRAAAARIGELALLMKWEHVDNELLSMYLVLAHDGVHQCLLVQPMYRSGHCEDYLL